MKKKTDNKFTDDVLARNRITLQQMYQAMKLQVMYLPRCNFRNFISLQQRINTSGPIMPKQKYSKSIKMANVAFVEKDEIVM